MRYLAVLLLTLFAAAAQAESTSLKRLTLRHDLLGLEAVGRLEVGDEGYCTGTLIAPDLVLTAAHCIYDRDQRIDPGRLRFRAGLRDGEAVAERNVARSVAHPDYRPLSAHGAERVRHDVALLELKAPVSVGEASPFRVTSLRVGLREVGVVSYARGRDAAPSRQAACAVVGRQGGLMAFDCDVDFGASGAPVFDRTGRRPTVVSIISSGRRDGEGSLSFGMDLVASVALLRDALRNGQGVSVASGASETTFRRIRPGNTDLGGARFIRP